LVLGYLASFIEREKTAIPGTSTAIVQAGLSAIMNSEVIRQPRVSGVMNTKINKLMGNADSLKYHLPCLFNSPCQPSFGEGAVVQP
jgi:hypothetical protein